MDAQCSFTEITLSSLAAGLGMISANSERPIVIVVDDDCELLQTVADAIRSLGMSVQTFEPSRDFLEKLPVLKCDLLITDILMPDVDGLELIRALRRTNQQVPVVAMSGGGDTLPASTGLRFSEAFGATRILVKPFTMRELKDLITELLPSTVAP